jgi:hypothetical protein
MDATDSSWNGARTHVGGIVANAASLSWNLANFVTTSTVNITTYPYEE